MIAWNILLNAIRVVFQTETAILKRGVSVLFVDYAELAIEAPGVVLQEQNTAVFRVFR